MSPTNPVFFKQGDFIITLQVYFEFNLLMSLRGEIRFWNDMYKTFGIGPVFVDAIHS